MLMIMHLFSLFFAKIDSVFVRLYNLMIRGNFKQMDGFVILISCLVKNIYRFKKVPVLKEM